MSILDYAVLKEVLGIPQRVWIIAYLYPGYVKAFADQPDLEKAGRRKRLPLEQLVHYERWGNGREDGTASEGSLMPMIDGNRS